MRTITSDIRNHECSTLQQTRNLASQLSNMPCLEDAKTIPLLLHVTLTSAPRIACVISLVKVMPLSITGTGIALPS